MTLKFKLLLFIGVILFVAIGINTVILVQDIERDYRQAIEWRSASLAQSLRANISKRYSLYGKLGNLPLILESSFMQVKTLFEATQGLHGSDVSYVSVVDDAGVILAHNDRSMLKKNIKDRRLLDSLRKRELITVADQTDYHTFIPVVTGEGIYLATIDIGFPKVAVEEKVWRLLYKAVGLFVVTFSLIFLPVWFLVNRFVAIPVKQFVEATTAIAGGDLAQQIKIPNTAEFRSLSIALTQMRDSINANITVLAEKNRDLSEEARRREHAEGERLNLEQKLRQSQKMEAVGQLTGGIAHDFNNILGIVMGNLELLKRRVSNDETISPLVAAALDGVDRGAAITRKLLIYSRDDAGEEKLVLINEYVKGMEELIAKSLTVSIHTTTHLAENIWPVKVNIGDLQDALLNLSLNARDAMSDGGDLIFETSNKELDEEYVKCNPQAQAGEFVMLSISDTGRGMTAETREKAIEPFFTTKKAGKGTGLGLSMVYGFVQRSGGHIKIYSEVGEGTTIRIYLPRADENGKIENEEPIKNVLPRGDETILVVDDEQAMIKAASENLEFLGYKIITAKTGKQALKLFDTNKNIDLLFTDIIMPGEMDGYQLALTAHEMRPSLKVLLTSGFIKKSEKYVNGEEKYLSELLSHLLDKPYNQRELADAVRKALDERH